MWIHGYLKKTNKQKPKTTQNLHCCAIYLGIYLFFLNQKNMHVNLR